MDDNFMNPDFGFDETDSTSLTDLFDFENAATDLGSSGEPSHLTVSHNDIWASAHSPLPSTKSSTDLISTPPAGCASDPVPMDWQLYHGYDSIQDEGVQSYQCSDANPSSAELHEWSQIEALYEPLVQATPSGFENCSAHVDVDGLRNSAALPCQTVHANLHGLAPQAVYHVSQPNLSGLPSDGSQFQVQPTQTLSFSTLQSVYEGLQKQKRDIEGLMSICRQFQSPANQWNQHAIYLGESDPLTSEADLNFQQSSWYGAGNDSMIDSVGHGSIPGALPVRQYETQPASSVHNVSGTLFDTLDTNRLNRIPASEHLTTRTADSDLISQHDTRQERPKPSRRRRPLSPVAAPPKPRKKQRGPGKVHSYEVCHESWPNCFASQSAMTTRRSVDRSSFNKNPCVICRIKKQRCRGGTPCEQCTRLSKCTKSVLCDLDPCVNLEDDPFAYCLDPSLFYLSDDAARNIGDLNMRRGHNAPANGLFPAFTMASLSFFAGETGCPQHPDAHELVRLASYGTIIWRKIKCWKSFARSNSSRQLIFLTAVSLTITLLLELVVMHGHGIAAYDSQKYHAVRDCLITSVRQLLVLRFIMERRCGSNCNDFGHSPAINCLDRLRLMKDQSDTALLVTSMRSPSHARNWYYRGGRYNACSFLLGVAAKEGITTFVKQTLTNQALNASQINRRRESYMSLMLVFLSDTAANEFMSQGLHNRIASPEGLTALHIAVMMNRPCLVERLLDCGSDVDAQDDYGQTPLHSAFRSLSLEIIRILLRFNANPNLVTKSGRTPLDFAPSPFPLPVAYKYEKFWEVAKEFGIEMRSASYERDQRTQLESLLSTYRDTFNLKRSPNDDAELSNSD